MASGRAKLSKLPGIPFTTETTDTQVQQYLVRIKPNDFTRNHLKVNGSYILRLDSLKFTLVHPEKGNTLYVWPYKYLRKYGRDKVSFTIEVGRKCQSGPGLIVFETSDGNTIYNELVKYLNIIAQRIQEHQASVVGNQPKLHSRPAEFGKTISTPVDHIYSEISDQQVRPRMPHGVQEPYDGDYAIAGDMAKSGLLPPADSDEYDELGKALYADPKESGKGDAWKKYALPTDNIHTETYMSGHNVRGHLYDPQKEELAYRHLSKSSQDPVDVVEDKSGYMTRADIGQDQTVGQDYPSEQEYDELGREETPAEILARGPAALEAYIKASQDGTKSVYRTRLMLVGQERVGKTSLLKNITGQKFNSAESITDGVDASTRCEVAGNSNESWEIKLTAKTDLADHVQSQYMDTLCELMVQRLTDLSQEDKELQDDGQIRDTLQGQHMDSEPSSRQIDDTKKIREEENKHETQPAAKEAVVAGVLLERILEQLRKRKLENDLGDIGKESGVQEFQIWDFAGQDVYYTTHQVFLSNRAIYIVIFDLCHDLTKPLKIQIPNAEMVRSKFHELTGLGFLDFWMQSIYAYATTSQNQPDGKRPQLSPPIFIVGTHRESPDISKDSHERKQLIEAKFQSINDMIAGKPYEKHVVSRYYAIENSSTDKEDDEVSDMIAGKPYEKHVVSRYYAIENSSTDKDDHELYLLKEHIVSVANQEPYMGEKIPLRWLTFEKSLAEAINDGRHYMDLKKVKDMATDLGIKSDTELFTMLHFYHDLGTIIYFGGDDSTNSFLQDMVILDPQWLIDVFKRIITVMPHQKQWATLKDKWRRLKEGGILEDCLIDHMWHDWLHQKPALLALMEMFDLLCPRIHANEEGLDVRTYYVPACLQPCSEEDTQLQMAGERKQTTFYIDFHGFLPDGLFHRLMVHAARWSQQQSGEEPKLFHRYGDFCFNDEHSFELQMLTTKPICIKVTISIMPVMSAGESEEEDICLIQPSHMVCDSVKTFLTQTLQELTTTWVRGIRYTFSVACPACNDLSQPSRPHVSRCFHLLPLEECLNKTKITCKEKKKQVKTEVYKMWFQGVAAGDSLDTKGTAFSDVELLQLAEEIGIHWDVLAIYLGLKKCHVDALNSDYQLTVNKAFNMLIQWRQGLAKMTDARQLLKKALKKCNLANLVAKV